MALLSRWLNSTSTRQHAHLHHRQQRGATGIVVVTQRLVNRQLNGGWPAARRRATARWQKLAKQSMKINAATGGIWRRSHGHSTKRKNDTPRMPSWAAIWRCSPGIFSSRLQKEARCHRHIEKHVRQQNAPQAVRREWTIPDQAGRTAKPASPGDRKRSEYQIPPPARAGSASWRTGAAVPACRENAADTGRRARKIAGSTDSRAERDACQKENRITCQR
ncbi:Uncharacterised protein [Enterobacter asburiae]|uniref:Uncharacterized protein n=1 Tax=Enterobacter asburiae TaxID=61645 RepID=A0A376FM13_ENTAS|nr:Uncharacterised protein [Enterobacter asburiae]